MGVGRWVERGNSCAVGTVGATLCFRMGVLYFHFPNSTGSSIVIPTVLL